MSIDKQAVRDFEHAGWERAAAAYDDFASATRQFIPDLLEAGGIRAGVRVLDVACGPGLVAAAAAERGAQAAGVDFSAAMLDQARSRHPSLTFDQGDAEALPYPDASFDAVVSNFGIHHVPDPLAALREARRVLRPGGRIAFTIWAEPSENVAWRLLFDAIARCGDPSASCAPSPGGGFATAEHCRTALADAGFQDTGTRLLRASWRHPDAESLVRAFRDGTARMSALIEAQASAALSAIIADIAASAAEWRDRGGLALPIAAWVASART